MPTGLMIPIPVTTTLRSLIELCLAWGVQLSGLGHRLAIKKLLCAHSNALHNLKEFSSVLMEGAMMISVS